MADYNFRDIEQKQQRYWEKNDIYKTDNLFNLPKYYVLDMFPYPSGAGLHVGHPLGYIASDIVARYKRHKGFNVLHPMGFDSFGLPAEQYAVQTGQHPAITTENNIARYKEQLRRIGFSFEWSREVRTSDPAYYRWTQKIFLLLFGAWYNRAAERAEPVVSLVALFEREGNAHVQAACDPDTPVFTAADWAGMSARERSDVLLRYRLAYPSEAVVNWCPELGTVLANEEVKDGLSERGGYPVVRKKMNQWSLRITAYADRLLQELESLDWPEAVKEMQRHWIGKSEGAELYFTTEQGAEPIRIFTTRVDTVFGVSYLALAPEHESALALATPDRVEDVKKYIEKAVNRSERDRMSDVKTVSGVFTGSYARHPFSGAPVPIWVADYVLGGYGTGAVMGVPAHDSRDFLFARHFDLPVQQVIVPPAGAAYDAEAEAYEDKQGTVVNSDFIDGLSVPEAIEKAILRAEATSVGRRRVNYRIRDAVFGRQRYWGEPIPIYYQDGMPHALSEEELPLLLPEIDEYKPTETGEPPLARAVDWKYQGRYEYELSTMPGWAGSSWYFLRYTDPHNEQAMFDREAQQYWGAVDLYIGGAEHATGHLLYARFWTKFLYDLGLVSMSEPFKKLVNQGMIQGQSSFVYRLKGTNTFVSYGLKDQYDAVPMHTDVSLVEDDVLNLEGFRHWRPDLADAEFILEDGKYLCGTEVEKMSKSLHNVINPDDIIERYGADTLRMYEMFLGPLEQSKPWSTHGIDGVHKFLKRFWRLFHDEQDGFSVTDEAPSAEELKILHKTIKKIGEDIEGLSLNTSVSAFMICVNELTALKCRKRLVLEPLTVLLSPFAPHIAEELWQLLGHTDSVTKANWPHWKQEYMEENNFEYPVSVNGKLRFKMVFSNNTLPADIEREVLASVDMQKWLGGKRPKKVIVVPRKIVNVVI